MSSPEGLIWREMQQQTLSGDKKSPEKLFRLKLQQMEATGDIPPRDRLSAPSTYLKKHSTYSCEESFF
jgi:hypothetical protein